MARPVRIFISSPGDVKEEREKAEDVIDELERSYGGELDLQPVVWEDMPLHAGESFQAGIDFVLADGTGIDVAVFILWSRLGTPPAGIPPRADGRPYLSGTEREFDLMLAAHRKSKTGRPHILVYRRDEEKEFMRSVGQQPAVAATKMLEQWGRCDRFFTENFTDANGRNSGAYHSYSGLVTFARRLGIHLRQITDRLVDDDDLLLVRWHGPPYRGLEVFDIDHARIFFGRENDVWQIEDLLAKRAVEEGCGFVVLVGASGSGKSSLARAGVVDVLLHHNYEDRVRQWRYAVFSPGKWEGKLMEGLVEALAAEDAFRLELVEHGTVRRDLATHLERAPGPAVERGLLPVIRRASDAIGGPVHLVLVVDQLEELFTDRNLGSSDREAFFSALEALARCGHVRILATLRSDFFEAAHNSPGFLRLKGHDGMIVVQPPDGAALRRIVCEPARRAGVRFERLRDGKSLDDQIIDDFRSQPQHDALPLLQDALRELYEQCKERKILTFAAYEAIGRWEGALGHRAEAIVAGLSSDAQTALNKILPALVTVSVGSTLVAVRRIAQRKTVSDSADKDAVVELLIKQRLLTAAGDKGSATVVLAHEALLRAWATLSAWVTRYRNYLRIRASIEHDYNRWKMDPPDQRASLLLPPGTKRIEAKLLLAEAPQLLTPDLELEEYVRRSLQADEVAGLGGEAEVGSIEAMTSLIERHMVSTLGRTVAYATPRDWWMAAVLTIRDTIHDRMVITKSAHREARHVYYFSPEYLMGRLFGNNLVATGLYEIAKEALESFGTEFEAVRDAEVDMGLGNGGLGRLAACFLDSLATLDYPAMGYGIYYEFGLFKQTFKQGHQEEHPDNWTLFGNPWEIVRPEYTQHVWLYGRVEQVFDNRGNYRPRWVGTKTILGVPHDIPVAGYGTKTVNVLRLWASKATADFDLAAFNSGGYVEAVRDKVVGETISKVLYPNDRTEAGKELRLVQQYFFVACSLRDIVRRHFRMPGTSWDNFPNKIAIQLNDTHPAIAVIELMRILVDEHYRDWDDAWSIVTRTFAFTNHALLPEALEKWSVPLFERVLPRHLQLIYDINARLMETVEARWPGDDEKKRVCSLIEEGRTKMVRMANLAVVSSHAVNGVAALHTALLRRRLFPEFDALYPGKFQNKTNGITPRRWLLKSNPRLAALITRRLGSENWVRDLTLLRRLEKIADDGGFQREVVTIKRANKIDLAAVIKAECNVDVSPDALFDVQITRLHEYKRQHLNLLHILTLYRRLLQKPELDMVPRVFVFGSKASPGYDLAKNIIRAINVVGARINAEARLKGRLKIAFLPNYRVSLAEKIIPAADLSEQISTAGKEATGTGRMKLALNGALTIGTLAGANVEIKEEVGDDNIFIFGMTVEEVEALRARGYNPWDFYHRDEELRAVVDWLGSDYFTPNEHGALRPVHDSLLSGGDPSMVLADFRSYVECQARVEQAYRDPARWARMAILNTARMGKFSSDRTIREYAKDIWNLRPVPVK